jgi:hypothetical protein
MFKNSAVIRATHGLDVFFANFNKRFDGWGVLYRQRRKRCRRNDVIARVDRSVSEIAPFNIPWSSLLELVTQGIPESPMIKLCMSEHTKHADSCRDMVSCDRPSGELVYPGVHAGDEEDEHATAH